MTWPLRPPLFQMLLWVGLLVAAAAYFRPEISLLRRVLAERAAARFPDDLGLKVGLAQTFYQHGKPGPALVIVEDLLKRPDTQHAEVRLHARLLDRVGDVDRAVRQYKESIALDPALADPEFAGRLGIGADDRLLGRHCPQPRPVHQARRRLRRAQVPPEVTACPPASGAPRCC